MTRLFPGSELETCPTCMGSGYSNHPDSGEICNVCRGKGGVPAVPQAAPTANATHYLSAIRTRLESLYELLPDDPRLREHISDEVDWVEAEIERLTALPAPPQGAREALEAAKEFLDDEFSDCNDLPRKARLSALCDKVDAALSRPLRQVTDGDGK